MFVVTGTVGVTSRSGLDLVVHEIGRLVSDEPLPVEVEAMDRPFAMRCRRLDLRPIGIRVAPKGSPPSLVQSFK
jgi:hypothetical protein